MAVSPIRPTQSDVFICHASEDKEEVARPLAKALIDEGVTVWLDELKLKLGDSLLTKIDEALRDSRFGVVILSPSFFKKQWPARRCGGWDSLSKGGITP